MGKVFSMVSKPIRDFNLENRAHKVISKDKPIAAPKHKADIVDYERILKGCVKIRTIQFKQLEHFQIIPML